MPATLILASASPRRADLLAAAGIPFQVRIAHVDETRIPEEKPEDYVRRLARRKAEAVTLHHDEVILGADTTVVCGNEMLEKPVNAADAVRMLRLLSGRKHQVITGICLRMRNQIIDAVETTHVEFLPMDDAEIEAYAATSEPFDKAGGYAIQGLASKYIRRVEGCYFNVVGLPVSLVCRCLRSLALE